MTDKGWHEATFYVQIEPSFYQATNYNPDPGLSKIRATRLTQSRTRVRGAVSVKLTVRVPDGAFLPLRPEAVIVIPEGMAVVDPVEVEANEPEPLP